MPAIPETVLVKQEEDALRAELEWILSDEQGEVQSVFTELRRLLKSCHERLSTQPGADPSVQPASYHSCPLTMENDTVKGVVTLTGHSITRANIQLKFAKLNKGQPVSTSISPAAPWIVNQIKNAANHVFLAHNEICGAGDQLAALQAAKDQSNLGAHLIQVRDFVSQAMEKTMQSLNQAKSQIVRPQATTLASAMQETTNLAVFRPKLPEGVAVCFHVNGASLVTDVFVLGHVHQPSNPKPSQCKIGKKWYEVEERVQLESSIPSLADSALQINTTIELCQRLRDNLAALAIKLP